MLYDSWSPNKKTALAALLIAFVAGLLIGTAMRSAYRAHRAANAPKIAWCEGDACVAKVCPKYRRTVVLFTATWCTAACKNLDAKVLDDPEVRIRLSTYGAIKADADRDSLLAISYGVQAYPMMVIVDQRGNLIARASGVGDPDSLLGFLDGLEKIRP